MLIFAAVEKPVSWMSSLERGFVDS